MPVWGGKVVNLLNHPFPCFLVIGAMTTEKRNFSTTGQTNKPKQFPPFFWTSIKWKSCHGSHCRYQTPSPLKNSTHTFTNTAEAAALHTNWTTFSWTNYSQQPAAPPAANGWPLWRKTWNEVNCTRHIKVFDMDMNKYYHFHWISKRKNCTLVQNFILYSSLLGSKLQCVACTNAKCGHRACDRNSSPLWLNWL